MLCLRTSGSDASEKSFSRFLGSVLAAPAFSWKEGLEAPTPGCFGSSAAMSAELQNTNHYKPNAAQVLCHADCLGNNDQIFASA